MRLRILLFLLLFLKFESRNACSQILFNNPSFEENGPCNDCQPNGWYQCAQTPDIFPPSISDFIPVASNGNLYVNLASGPVNTLFSESIGTKINCNLKANFEFYFHVDLRSGVKVLGHGTEGILRVYEGQDSCSMANLLWESPRIDSTKWTSYLVSFISSDDINSFVFKTESIDTNYTWIFIDNLSPIYCSNYNKVKLNFSSDDTSIIRGDCVSLKATANEYYDSLYWQSFPSGFSSNSLDAGEVCPDESTTYIVAIKDTGCGHFWSYDTLRVSVTVPDEPVIYGPENGVIKLISNADGYLVLYDMLGRIAKIIKIEEGEQTISLTNVLLSAGMYIAQVQTILRQTNRKLIWVK